MIDNSLLKINVTNAQLDVTVKAGGLKNTHDSQPNKIEQHTTGSGVIDTQITPAKIKVDTYEARSSLGYGHYNSTDFNKNQANIGIQKAKEGTSKIVSDGDQMVTGTHMPAIIEHDVDSDVRQTITAFLPKGGADITADKGSISQNYQSKTVDISFKDTAVVPLEYVPAQIDVSFSRGVVEVEYTGDPIYVPPSAKPDYI
ncbi:MAG: DUF6470 family protein [Oscillospiraceae bacterium]|jgi:hypothetical protein|nr:DUF6470 family protein [Oscillospiraceae bacterium]